VGNSGPGSIWHIAALSLEKAAGIKLVHVPFDGAAPAVAALLGGHITAVTVSPTEVKAGVESGQLRILAVMSDERTPLFPDVPTMKELGYDVSIAAWGGLALPKGVDPEVYKILADAFKKAYDSETFQKFLLDRGMTPAYLDGQKVQGIRHSSVQHVHGTHTEGARKMNRRLPRWAAFNFEVRGWVI